MSATTVGATDLTFIHLTDLHLLATDDAQINGQSPTQKLRTIIERIRAMEIRPTFLLITGDLVNDGQPAEYETLNRLLPALQSFEVPIILGMGNHDARGFFRQIILGEANSANAQPYYHSTLIDGVNIIMLDSQIPNQVPGFLDPAQLAWLAAELAKPVAVGHLIALHHPPVSSTVAFLDPLMLTNPQDLAAVVAGHDNVLGILSGHIHYNHVARFQQTFSFTTPAVLYTLDPGVQKNFRVLDGSGFAIGTIRRGELFMNTVMTNVGEKELTYRRIEG
jgi:3',5'-cyclic-AMP phosphodiesterase